MLGVDLEKESKSLAAQHESGTTLQPTNVAARAYRVTVKYQDIGYPSLRVKNTRT
jgi:hypothetical protein